MWYETTSKKSLDMSKPIFADGYGETYLLVPQINEESEYNVVGYNWFNIRIGSYNSCMFYPTPEAAVVEYTKNFTLYNGEIKVDKV